MAPRMWTRLKREEGMTLVELLTTMTILAFVMSGILAVYVGGLRATTDMNERFQAQQNARLALTSMRKDVRTACSESVPVGGMSVTLGELDATGNCTVLVSWCVSSSTNAAPFGLYRQTGGSCSWSTGVKRASQLTTTTASGTATIFAAPNVGVSGTRPQLAVTLPIDANLSTSQTVKQGLYILSDTMTLRNAGVQ